jgi:hypothetical protein
MYRCHNPDSFEQIGRRKNLLGRKTRGTDDSNALDHRQAHICSNKFAFAPERKYSGGSAIENEKFRRYEIVPRRSLELRFE